MSENNFSHRPVPSSRRGIRKGRHNRNLEKRLVRTAKIPKPAKMKLVVHGVSQEIAAPSETLGTLADVLDVEALAKLKERIA